MDAASNSQNAAKEYGAAQRQFMALYQEYLVNEVVNRNADSAQMATQKMMVSAAQMVAGKNLEDLNDFSRDYLVAKTAE